MLGSNILEVVLGLSLIFLMLSFMATAIREALESVIKARAVYLERGIRELLGDRDGTGIAKAFYEHPLIASLYRGTFDHKESRVRGGTLPTYIPARTFAQALMDLALRGPVTRADADTDMERLLSLPALRESATRLGNPHLVRAVLTACDHADGDLNKALQNLQTWFDSSMDRVSGWYKRTTHAWLFGIGLTLAILLNVNMLRVTEGLWRDKELRHAVATRAEAVARDTSYQRQLRDSAFSATSLKQTYRDLNALRLPIGWSDSARAEVTATLHAGAGTFLKFFFWTFIGFVPTALAVTLGAPFWFDALNKIMVIRSTVKPHEKSPEESSEDRQTGK
jgi:hypothetical protein